MKVHVDQSTPAGYLNDHLMLVTNDAPGPADSGAGRRARDAGHYRQSRPRCSWAWFSRARKSPSSWSSRARSRSASSSITCDDKSFQFDTSKEDAAKELHLIPVTFTAGTDAGKVVKTIKIKTDQGEMTPELAAYAVVAAAQ